MLPERQAERGSRGRLVFVPGDEYDLALLGQGGALLDGHRNVKGVQGSELMLQDQAVCGGQNYLGTESKEGDRSVLPTVGVYSGKQFLPRGKTSGS